MASQNPVPNVEELERQAEADRERVRRDVAGLRQDVRRQLDVRRRVQDGIHSNPRAYYGAAAGTALFTGYLLARILKA